MLGNPSGRGTEGAEKADGKNEEGQAREVVLIRAWNRDPQGIAGPGVVQHVIVEQLHDDSSGRAGETQRTERSSPTALQPGRRYKQQAPHHESSDEEGGGATRPGKPRPHRPAMPKRDVAIVRGRETT